MDNENRPLTVADLANFVESFRVALAKPAAGDAVMPHEILVLHSDVIAEDGRRLRLWDLVDDGTGAQVDDGPIRHV